MNPGIHFISGLPRAGSTLLAALLRQNPRFCAGMSSPVMPIYASTQLALSAKNEFHVFITDRQRESVLRGLFRNFYEDDFGRRLIFDTSRIWCSKLNGLAKLFPDCRVLCCVRSVSWILDSFERLHNANALQLSRIYNLDQVVTVYGRSEFLTGPNGIVRVPYDGLREAFLGEHADRLLLIQYESLARSPHSAMAAIYEFLGQEPFTHDFNNVEFEADEFDRMTGSPGLHSVRKEVRYMDRPTILPVEIFRKFDKPFSFWADPAINIRNVKII